MVVVLCRAGGWYIQTHIGTKLLASALTVVLFNFGIIVNNNRNRYKAVYI